MRRLVPVLFVAPLLPLLTACGDGASAPTVPRTREQASQALDEALVTLNWAQQDLFKLGGRDIVVSVQLDTALAPHYFRLPRPGAK